MTVVASEGPFSAHLQTLGHLWTRGVPFSDFISGLEDLGCCSEAWEFCIFELGCHGPGNMVCFSGIYLVTSWIQGKEYLIFEGQRRSHEEARILWESKFCSSSQVPFTLPEELLPKELLHRQRSAFQEHRVGDSKMKSIS